MLYNKYTQTFFKYSHTSQILMLFYLDWCLQDRNFVTVFQKSNKK